MGDGLTAQAVLARMNGADHMLSGFSTVFSRVWQARGGGRAHVVTGKKPNV